MRSSQRIHFIYFLSLITAFFCEGCKPIKDVATALKIEQPVEEYSDSAYEAGDEAYPAGYYIHTVSVINENMSIIAKWYTGEQENWVILAKCNTTKNPNLIFLGTKIKIPRSIMIRNTNLPVNFVNQSHSAAKRKKASTVPVPKVHIKNPLVKPTTEETPNKPDEEEPQFFGPKAYK